MCLIHRYALGNLPACITIPSIASKPRNLIAHHAARLIMSCSTHWLSTAQIMGNWACGRAGRALTLCNFSSFAMKRLAETTRSGVTAKQDTYVQLAHGYNITLSSSFGQGKTSLECTGFHHHPWV